MSNYNTLNLMFQSFSHRSIVTKTMFGQVVIKCFYNNVLYKNFIKDFKNCFKNKYVFEQLFYKKNYNFKNVWTTILEKKICS